MVGAGGGGKGGGEGLGVGWLPLLLFFVHPIPPLQRHYHDFSPGTKIIIMLAGGGGEGGEKQHNKGPPGSVNCLFACFLTLLKQTTP